MKRNSLTFPLHMSKDFPYSRYVKEIFGNEQHKHFDKKHLTGSINLEYFHRPVL